MVLILNSEEGIIQDRKNPGIIRYDIVSLSLFLEN